MAALYLVSPFKRKANLLLCGRRSTLGSIAQKMDSIRASRSADTKAKAHTTWIHAASLGEFEQARNFIDRLREQSPNEIIIVTFFSPSGYVPRANYPAADGVFYLPADTKANARKVVEAIDADCVVFVKYEFWYYYLREIERSGAQLLLISALFQKKSQFFKWYGGFFRGMLHKFSHLFVQDKYSAKLLYRIGIANVTVAGDTRFDRVLEIAQQAKELQIVESFTSQATQTLIVGSSWEEDEKLIAKLTQDKKELKVIIAPHNVNDDNIERIKKLFQSRTIALYTQSTPEDVTQAEVLIIDCIGILSRVYRYGSLAYIGGGFGSGIHNILEAATWGLPVIFGPKYQRFAEAHDLIELGGGVSVKNLTELESAFENTIGDLENRSKISREYVQRKAGATERILQYINQD